MKNDSLNLNQNQKPGQTNKGGLSKKVGDAIERVGETIERAGFKKAGDAIHKLGDKVEHSGDSTPKK